MSPGELATLRAPVKNGVVEADVCCLRNLASTGLLDRCLIISTVGLVKVYLAYYSDKGFTLCG